MALIDAQLLERFHELSLLARRAGCRGLLTPHGILPAGGTEATGLRDYAPGDDYRAIDWHCCARRDELLTRLFQGGEDRYTHILVDCSPSMGRGSPSKFQLARQIAAALGYVSLLSGDCLRLAAFAAALVTELPPLRGKVQIARTMRFLEDLPLHAGQTDLGRTAEDLLRRSQRRGLVVVLSDFFDQRGFQRGLGMLLAAGYEPRVVQIYEPREADSPLPGDVSGRPTILPLTARGKGVGDKGAATSASPVEAQSKHETILGRLRKMAGMEAQTARPATTAQRDLERQRRLFADFCEALRRWCAQRDIPCLQLASDTPPQEVFLRILGGKERAAQPRTD